MKRTFFIFTLLLTTSAHAATILNAADPNAQSGTVIRVNNDNDLTTYCDFSKAIVKSVTNFYLYCVKK